MTNSSVAPPGRWRALAALATTMVLAMSTWFATAAALPALRDDLDLGEPAARWLAIAVQLGFVCGALASALLSLADRVSPRRLAARGSVALVVINIVPVLVPSVGTLMLSRFLVGAAVALVCPPLLSAMATWFYVRRGLALGVMVGALTLGSAAPHLVNGLGAPSWRAVLAITSLLALVGGGIVRWATSDGPHRPVATGFDPRRVVGLASNRGVRLACAGYLGHMWELYAGWAAMAVFLHEVYEGNERASAVATFAVIAIGAAGSVAGGLLGERWGKAQAAKISLLCSGVSVAGLAALADGPRPVVMLLALVWGFWVIADSAQFTALVTEHAEPDQVGTAVTVQLAIGFALTAATMWLVPAVHQAFGWGWALLLLAPGPLLAAVAMKRLQINSEVRRATAPSSIGLDDAATVSPLATVH